MFLTLKAYLQSLHYEIRELEWQVKNHRSATTYWLERAAEEEIDPCRPEAPEHYLGLAQERDERAENASIVLKHLYHSRDRAIRDLSKKK